MAGDIIRVRGAKPYDMSTVLDIEKFCFPDPYPMSLLSRLYFTNPEGFLVAEVDGKVVGYLIGTLRWGASGHIMAIGVYPEYRKRGVGTALMVQILDILRMRGARSARLEVRKSNDAAQLFYQKLGFKLGEEISHYYEDGEAAIVMSREL
ncbi:MAG: ribosomal-protein-alanine N-acetyltransferase [Hadesarchaea archaeon CG08_land_8_20_14_0_20_51_8]|nr:MAG: ribosomal-protein-alanine N-acetyltransferase [Hadesarchaea archaeon CG08_land_8_20_14_0_20_51_8]